VQFLNFCSVIDGGQCCDAKKNEISKNNIKMTLITLITLLYLCRIKYIYDDVMISMGYIKEEKKNKIYYKRKITVITVIASS